MRYIVFDLEWNMAGGRYEEVGRPRIAKRFQNLQVRKIPTFEIFQIGAVCLDEQIKEVSRFEQKIKPQIYPEINKYVQRLTGIEQSQLKDAPYFATVIFDYYAWIFACLPAHEQIKLLNETPSDLFTVVEDNKVELNNELKIKNSAKLLECLHNLLKKAEILFCVWSTSDANPLKSNLRYYELNDLLPAKFLDLQKVYALFSGDQPGLHSVKRATEFLQLTETEDYHDALNDAKFTARIMQALLPAIRLAAWEYAKIPLPEKYLPNKMKASLAKLQEESKRNQRQTNMEKIEFSEFTVPYIKLTNVAESANVTAVDSVNSPGDATGGSIKSSTSVETAAAAKTADSAPDTATLAPLSNLTTSANSGDASADFNENLVRTIWQSSLERPSWLARKQTTTALISALQNRDRQRRKNSAAQIYTEQVHKRNNFDNICTLSDIEEKLRHKLELLGAEELANYLLTLSYDPNGKKEQNSEQLSAKRRPIDRIVDENTKIDMPEPVQDHLVKRINENLS